MGHNRMWWVMTDNLESRAGRSFELRDDSDGSTVRIEGYAAVFDSPTNIGGVFIERVAPGAFTDALDRQDDVILNFNHEPVPLARTTSGTLRLEQDDHGLKVSADLDRADPDVARLLPKMQRGDLGQMSFQFFSERDTWDDTGDVPERTLESVGLRDVSIVTFPAYDDTSVALRSRNSTLPEIDLTDSYNRAIQLRIDLLKK